MRAITNAKRKYLIAAAVVVTIGLGAYGLGQFYPPLGPTAGTITPAPRSTPLNGQVRGRHVLVDAATAQLFMIEDGKVRGSMRVIVGKPASATPALSSVLHYATLNPYWNVPLDLGQTLIAPKVVKDGVTYLKDRNYEVVSNYGPTAQVLEADSVDWKKVAAGEAQVHIRQRPGPANSMGQLKFPLMHGDGIYLHDTPKKELFAQADRNLSNGCVRLEDAPRLARWLLGKDPALAATDPEQHLVIPGAVPITIAYLDPGAQLQLAGLQ